jgi:hypothetical protein
MHLASTSVEALNVQDSRSLLSGLGALGSSSCCSPKPGC